jgi:nitroreductase
VRASETLPVAFLILLIIVALGASCAPVSGSMGGQEKPQMRGRRVLGNNQPSENANAKDGTIRTEMSDTNDEKKETPASSAFYMALKKALRERKLKLETVCEKADPVSRRVLEDYGAMFLADTNVLPPPVCMFTSEAEVLKFQMEARPTAAVIGGAEIELQPAAMNALLAAREEARSLGLDITPRGGSEAARRTYDDTLRLWNTRFLPALTHWNKLGRLSKEEVANLRQLPLRAQVREVLELEKDGIFFSKDFSKSILYSIAAPGTSQHIAMLALDVDQFMNERVRRILARHGWFQTVKSDLPHFTYLGLEEADLPSRGLRAVISGKQLFWIPNVSGE